MRNNRVKNTRRFNSKIQVLKDNLAEPKTILKIFLPLLIGIGLVLFFAYASVNLGYINKVIYTEENIPEELQQSLVILDSKDIADDSEEFNKITAILESLYIKRKLSSVNFYILNLEENQDEAKNIISSKLKKVNPEAITYNFLYNDVKDVCINVQKNGTEKGIIFTTGDKILRTLYICNSKGLYFTGFKIEESESIRGVQLIEVSTFINDFLENIFNKNRDER